MGIAEDIAELERRLDELKVEYEHYFSGRARIEPDRLRKALQGRLSRWHGKPINNTMFKFRYTNLAARYSSISTYWNRCLQEIEDGTFKRDTFRLQLRERERKERDEQRSRLDTIIAGRERREGGSALYKEFVAARSACGLSAGEVGLEAFETFIKRQREDIQSRFSCKEVEFKVSVEECKVRLVAKPIRGGRASGEKLPR